MEYIRNIGDFDIWHRNNSAIVGSYERPTAAVNRGRGRRGRAIVWVLRPSTTPRNGTLFRSEGTRRGGDVRFTNVSRRPCAARWPEYESTLKRH